MYVRAIKNIESWILDDVNKIPVQYLNAWFEDKSELSVYKLENIDDDSTLKSIILRLLIESPNKWGSGFELLVLDDELFLKIPKVQDDENKKSNCLHGIIGNATYKTFIECVEYTFKNANVKGKVIYCEFDKIREILFGLSNKEFSWYINQKDDSTKIKNTVNKITNFFNPEKSSDFPIYIEPK